MSRIVVVDSGGTSRQVRRFTVVDSGGTSRLIKRGVVIDSGGTARTFFQYLSATLSGATYSRIDGAAASFRVGSDGNIYATNFGGESLQYAWIVTGSASEFEVRVDATSGSFTSGTAGAWQSCAVDRTWTRAWSGVPGQTTTVIFTVQIRFASDATVAASASVGLSSTSF